MYLSWRLVWHWTFADRAQFRPLDRHHGRDLKLHPLCRLLDRPGLVVDRRDRAGLAAMEVARHVAWRLFDWPIPRRQYFVAEARRRIGRTAPGVADFRAAGVRQPIWFHRSHYRRTLCRRRRSDLAVCRHA